MDADSPLPEWPAAERNKGPILEVLARVFPTEGLMLEVASGTGQHAEHFAHCQPGWTWQASDLDPDNLEAIAERVRRAALPNLRTPLRLDVCETGWPLERADGIYCANMVHIAPWQATLGLMAGAGRLLGPGGMLVTYGPYQIDGAHTADSNARFDASLRERDPRWGVRDLTHVAEVAAEHGLFLQEKVTMPANNFTIVWEKRG